MNRKELEQVMVDTASLPIGITGGQAVFEYAWELIDILSEFEIDVKDVRVVSLDNGINSLTINWICPDIAGSLMMDGDESEGSITACWTMLNRKDQEYLQNHDVLFSDLDRQTFTIRFKKDLIDVRLP